MMDFKNKIILAPMAHSLPQWEKGDRKVVLRIQNKR